MRCEAKMAGLCCEFDRGHNVPHRATEGDGRAVTWTAPTPMAIGSSGSMQILPGGYFADMLGQTCGCGHPKVDHQPDCLASRCYCRDYHGQASRESTIPAPLTPRDTPTRATPLARSTFGSNGPERRIQELEAEVTRLQDLNTTLADRASAAQAETRRLAGKLLAHAGACGPCRSVALACAHTRGRDHSLLISSQGSAETTDVGSTILPTTSVGGTTRGAT